MLNRILWSQKSPKSKILLTSSPYSFFFCREKSLKNTRVNWAVEKLFRWLIQRTDLLVDGQMFVPTFLRTVVTYLVWIFLAFITNLPCQFSTAKAITGKAITAKAINCIDKNICIWLSWPNHWDAFYHGLSSVFLRLILLMLTPILFLFSFFDSNRNSFIFVPIKFVKEF